MFMAFHSSDSRKPILLVLFVALLLIGGALVLLGG